MPSIVQDLVEISKAPGSRVSQDTRNIAFEFLVRLANEGSVEARIALNDLRRASRKKATDKIGDQYIRTNSSPENGET